MISEVRVAAHSPGQWSHWGWGHPPPSYYHPMANTTHPLPARYIYLLPTRGLASRFIAYISQLQNARVLIVTYAKLRILKFIRLHYAKSYVQVATVKLKRSKLASRLLIRIQQTPLLSSAQHVYRYIYLLTSQ